MAATVEYPHLSFHYSVEWGDSRIGFSEVSGLNKEAQVVEYREGANNEYHASKMPGIPKYGNITLKRGIASADDKFFQWINATQLNVPDRRSMKISLLDETHQPVMSWLIHNAFPSKLEGPSFKGTGNEVAIESLELACEKWEVII
jgi:phage tail-like protein